MLEEYLRSLSPAPEILFDCRAVGGSMYAGGTDISVQERAEQIPPPIITVTYPDEVDDFTGLREGMIKEVLVNVYERNPEARQRCLEHHGYTCQCCLVDMQSIYGELGRNYIHVHHKIPLADIGTDYQVDPINDLVPVCPNCHAMLHRTKTVLTVERLKEIIHCNRNLYP